MAERGGHRNDHVKEEKLRDKIRKLFALMGSENTAEREAARAKIVELLGKNKKTWNDLTELLATGNAKGWHDDEPAAVGGGKAAPAPLQLINHILERHLHLTDAQRVAMTLWIAHTFKYHEFSVTPRLALISPVRGCGKTTALSIIKALSFNASKLDSITAAVLFRIIDRARACVLLDEVDNLDLLNNPALRAVITSGHHCDGAVSRCLKGEIQEFTTFAPLALAAIGKPPNPLPLPIAHRCVTIHMKRAPSTSEPLVRFDPKTYPRQKADLETVYRETFAWAQQCKLETNPPMPAELRNRPADPTQTRRGVTFPALIFRASLAAPASCQRSTAGLQALHTAKLTTFFQAAPTTEGATTLTAGAFSLGIQRATGNDVSARNCLGPSNRHAASSHA